MPAAEVVCHHCKFKTRENALLCARPYVLSWTKDTNDQQHLLHAVCVSQSVTQFGWSLQLHAVLARKS